MDRARRLPSWTPSTSTARSTATIFFMRPVLSSPNGSVGSLMPRRASRALSSWRPTRASGEISVAAPRTGPRTRSVKVCGCSSTDVWQELALECASGTRIGTYFGPLSGAQSPKEALKRRRVGRAGSAATRQRRRPHAGARATAVGRAWARTTTRGKPVPRAQTAARRRSR